MADKKRTLYDEMVEQGQEYVRKAENVLESVAIQRTAKYGQSWRLSSAMIALCLKYYPKAGLWSSPYVSIWSRIVVKVVRALLDPEDPEHWTDINGYSKIVLEDLVRGRENSEDRSNG